MVLLQAEDGSGVDGGAALGGGGGEVALYADFFISGIVMTIPCNVIP